MQVSRPEPLMHAAAYKSYQVLQPLSTHWRPATCAEVQCPHYEEGWGVRVENLTPDLLHEAKNSGRRYREWRVAEGETWLLFEPGQPCFRSKTHRIQIGRPPLYIVRDGDHRGNPRGTAARLHHNPDNWRDDFAEHQQRLADEIKKG
ncbi:hypothetical protein ACFV3E_24510 [Streptomyces sp. NPDC059718]